MKLADIKKGDIVYFKKSAAHLGTPHVPFEVEGFEVRKGKHNRVIVAGRKVSAGELTDTPCSSMVCGQCKYHKNKNKAGLIGGKCAKSRKVLLS